MPNYILDEYMKQRQASQGLDAQRVATQGQTVLNTLNTLRAKQLGQTLEPGSPENLLRQLQGMRTKSDISNIGTEQQASQFKSKADMIAAADDYAQKRLDLGVPGQQVADELATQNILPPGTEAKKIYDSELGRAIWNFRAPGQNWTPFNKEYLKAKDELGLKKAITSYTQSEEANAKLKIAGYRWTKSNELEAIPGGPADLSAQPPDMKGLPNLAKLQVYRQGLIDGTAPGVGKLSTGERQKLIDEVNKTINKPETLAQALMPMVKKVNRGEALSEDEIRTALFIKTLNNPFAQMMLSGMEESGQGLISDLREGTKGNRLPTAPNDPSAYNKFYNDLPPGASFWDPDGAKRTKPK